jgi:hypothetical protein
MMRADGSTDASDPDRPGSIQFMSMGGGFHVVTPQAGVFWNPANTVRGNYSLKGSFTLLKLSSHTNYYGLVFGGSGLEGAAQRYAYFLVAQNGTWILKHRDGNNARDIVGRTARSGAQADASGRSSTIPFVARMWSTTREREHARARDAAVATDVPDGCVNHEPEFR